MALIHRWQQAHPTRRLDSFAKVIEIPELLSLIFVHCLPRNNFAIPSSKKAPLNLSHVCHYWRDVALATPGLWTTLRLCSRGCSEEIADRHLQILNHWLRFSGRCLLSFQLIYLRAETVTVFVDSILLTILHHADRCRHIDIQAPAQCGYPLLKWLEKGSHVLEYICISSERSNAHSDEDISVTMNLSRFTNLRSFRVYSSLIQLKWIGVPTHLQTFGLYGDSFQVESCNSTANALKHLQLTIFGTKTPDILEVSKCFPELQSLDIFVNSWAPNSGLRRRIEFPHLRRLKLSTFEFIEFQGASLGRLLDCLDLPSLSSLNVNVDLPLYADWPHVADLLRYSSPPLTKLRMRANGLAEQCVLEILQLVPHLTRLNILSAHMDERTLVALTIPSVGEANTGYQPLEAGLFCPRLEYLSLHPHGLTIFPANLALDMITSRSCRSNDDAGQDTRPLLNHCRIIVDDEDYLRNHPKMKSYLEDGLKLVTRKSIW